MSLNNFINYFHLSNAFYCLIFYIIFYVKKLPRAETYPWQQCLFCFFPREGFALQDGVLDIATNRVSSILTYAPGYIEKGEDIILGLQTEKPLCRAVNPFAGFRRTISGFHQLFQKCFARRKWLFIHWICGLFWNFLWYHNKANLKGYGRWICLRIRRYDQQKHIPFQTLSFNVFLEFSKTYKNDCPIWAVVFYILPIA